MSDNLYRSASASLKWSKAQTFKVDEVAADPTTEPSVLLEIANHGTTRAMLKVLDNPSATDEILTAIYNNKPNFQMKMRLALNPKTPEQVLQAMLKDTYRTSESIVRALMNNPNLSTSMLTPLLPNEEWRTSIHYADTIVVRRACLHPNTPVNLALRSLPYLKERNSRKSVIRNRKQEIIQFLSPLISGGFQLEEALELYCLRNLPDSRFNEVAGVPMEWLRSLYPAVVPQVTKTGAAVPFL